MSGGTDMKQDMIGLVMLAAFVLSVGVLGLAILNTRLGHMAMIAGV